MRHGGDADPGQGARLAVEHAQHLRAGRAVACERERGGQPLRRDLVAALVDEHQLRAAAGERRVGDRALVEHPQRLAVDVHHDAGVVADHDPLLHVLDHLAEAQFDQRLVARTAHRAGRPREQGALVGGAGRVGRGLLQLHQQCAVAGVPARRWRIRWRRPVHAAVSARPALLPVSRPSSPDSHRPVPASASRSMPVSIPRPWSM